jgi:hypothetical protein
VTLNRPDNGTNPSALTLPHCRQSTVEYFDKYKCEIWDTLDILVPGPTHQSMFISTFVTTTEQYVTHTHPYTMTFSVYQSHKWVGLWMVGV